MSDVNKFDNNSMMYVLLFAILLFPWKYFYANGQCLQTFSQSNLRLQGHLIKSLSSSQSLQCVDECASHEDCHSINFFQDKEICELNDANHLTHPENMVSVSGSRYLNYFLHPVTLCSSKNCKNPLTCVMHDDGLNYSCKSSLYEVLKFPRKSITDKVVLENPFPDNLTAFTLSLWLQADPTTPQHTLFSYATRTSSKQISFYTTNDNHVEICIETCLKFNIDLDIIDGKWSHLCMTWESVQSKVKLYRDGRIVFSPTDGIWFRNIVGNGSIVLGQDQYSYKGGFDPYKSLQGNLTSVNMWDRVLTAPEISDLAKSCAEGEGNIVKWSDLKNRGEGDVKLIHTSACGAQDV